MHKKHVHRSALFAAMLVVAVVSGAIVYNLEHSLFETTLQENYALYQKEFANQKLALDTLRLRAALQSSTSTHGSFCARGGCNPYAITDFAVDKNTLLKLEPTNNYALSISIGNNKNAFETITENIKWAPISAQGNFATTSIPNIVLLKTFSAQENDSSDTFFHYINTTNRTVTSVDVLHQLGENILIVTDQAQKESHIAFLPAGRAIVVNGKDSYPVKLLPEDAGTDPRSTLGSELVYGGIDTTLTNIFFSWQRTNPKTQVLEKQLFAFNLKTKKVVSVQAFKNLLK